ncbi:hypothetical protein BGZ49_005705 [Haplosporangium sp. Z 27]|nr:hypothetical protein BGZ49_005705 [Haplosporangium sp. Z 27]
MPLLIHAVPLRKTWTGVHYWKTSKLEDLPLELEYLSYQEFEDRFNQLNAIAKPIFPSIWPNFGVAIFLVVLAVGAAFGIMRTGTTLSILGQGACFLVLLILIFKHRSQKLLRTWTARDAEQYAIQWKLRLRPIGVAKQWLGNWQSRQPEDNHNTHPNRAGHVDNGSNRTTTQHQNGITLARSSSTSRPLISTVSEPSPVAGASQTVRFSPQLHRTATRGSATPLAEQASEARTEGVTQEFLSGELSAESSTQHTASNTTNISTSEERQHTSIRSYIAECVRGSPQFLRYFRENNVWLIEISVRDCQLDDYTLTVPSPVYCDYRLPGYDDTVAMSGGNSSLAAIGARLRASSSRLGLNLYSGEPPAYESDTDDNDSDEDDSDDEAEDYEINERGSAINDIAVCASSEDDSSELQRTPEMTMIQRPVDMNSILVQSMSRQTVDENPASYVVNTHDR